MRTFACASQLISTFIVLSDQLFFSLIWFWRGGPVDFCRTSGTYFAVNVPPGNNTCAPAFGDINKKGEPFCVLVGIRELCHPHRR